MKMKPLFPLACAAILAVAASPAAAQVTITPYFWAAGMKGDVAPVAGLPTVETDSSFSDILDELQLGLASAFEVRMGQWAFVGDLSYVDTGVSAALKVPTTQFDSAGLDSKSLMSTLAMSYRVVDGDAASVDVLGGARLNWADNDVRLMRPDDTSVKANDDQFWVDPVVGVKAIAWLSPRWSLTGYGDVGGFGVSSDLTWQAMASVNYHFANGVALTAGYRYYAIDYDHDGFVFDVAEYGPLIGTSITF
ncbi:hypothetical protein [Brevundimonas goettingensis]|uniref:Outer membrane protein beta-barrel domain-containing protein n=1 Tax=Brevundimonas goettingensis TaxID=2774190 RepID=A0A975GX74_9CAUL|nr:hypothetical protein [Brevundimonas goettingensis]QTC90235.1 hypothetical protein IFJ75_13200 [Brevundimonas goettingensis]